MGTSGNELAVSATDFMTAITEFLCLSLSFLSRNYAIKTVKSAVGTDGVEEGKNRMLKARDNLNTDFARMAYFCIIRRNGNDEGEKFNAALSSLTYEAVHAGYRQARTHGTGEWFSQQFETWNKGDATLWCSGLPGAGKTFIASHAIDNIKKSLRPDIGLAYIYFDHKRYAEQTGPPGAQYGRPVFGSIMRQLLATRPSLIDEVLPLDINAPELDVVDKLCSLLKRFICTYLVVDALNEYSDDSDVRMRLVKELVATKERVGLKQFRIMITSRAADDVVKCVSPVQHIETKAEDADVKLMVLRRLEASTEFAERKMQSTTLSDDAVADQITRTAGKVFKLASLQVEAILRQPTLYKTNKALETLPKDVDTFYLESLERVKAQEDHRGIKILTWLAYATTPLHTHELQMALGYETTDEGAGAIDQMIVNVEKTVTLCEGLVVVQDSPRRDGRLPKTIEEDQKLFVGARVALAHPTIQDFLDRARDQYIPGGADLILGTCVALLSAPTLGEQINDAYMYYGSGKAQYSLYMPGRYHKAGDNAKAFVVWTFASWGHYCHSPLVSRPIPAFTRMIELHEQGSTPLHWCSMMGWDRVAQILLDASVDPNALDSYGKTALHVAIECDNVNTTKVLIADARVDINMRGHGELTPLCVAVLYSNFQLLHQLTASPRIVPNELSTYQTPGTMAYNTAVTPLMLAVALGRVKEATELMRMGDSDKIRSLVEARDPAERTALHYAACPSDESTFHSCAEIADLLLHSNPELINVRDVDGRTALSFAACSTLYSRQKAGYHNMPTVLRADGILVRKTIVERLLKADGIEVNAKDNNGATPLDWEIRHYRSLTHGKSEHGWLENDVVKAKLTSMWETIQLLEEHGAHSEDEWPYQVRKGRGPPGTPSKKLGTPTKFTDVQFEDSIFL